MDDAHIEPRSPLLAQPRDLTFTSVEGDFQARAHTASCLCADFPVFTWSLHGFSAPHTPGEMARPLSMSDAWNVTACSSFGCPLPQVFKGVWRMQEAERGGQHSRLSYCLFVRPQVRHNCCLRMQLHALQHAFPGWPVANKALILLFVDLAAGEASAGASGERD
jgi:hypothetical protein